MLFQLMHQTVKIISYALEANKKGLEPLDTLSNTISENGELFFDYNYNQIRDSVFVNLIYDTTLGFRIWKGQYLRDENSTPYRVNPWQWNIETAPSPMMWLYFDYYGILILSMILMFLLHSKRSALTLYNRETIFNI